MTWHILAADSTAGSPKVLCGVASPPATTHLGYLNMTAVGQSPVCQECAGRVTPTMLASAREELSNSLVYKPEQRNYSFLKGKKK